MTLKTLQVGAIQVLAPDQCQANPAVVSCDPQAGCHHAGTVGPLLERRTRLDLLSPLPTSQLLFHPPLLASLAMVSWPR